MDIRCLLKELSGPWPLRWVVDFVSEPLDFYIRGHPSSRLMKLPGSVLMEDHPEGLPVCIAAQPVPHSR